MRRRPSLSRRHMLAGAGALPLLVTTGKAAESCNDRANAVVAPDSERFALRASGSGRSYRIDVGISPKAPTAQGYPVIYMLDGNAVFLTALEALRLQTRGPKGFGSAIVVCIGYDTEDPLDTKERYIDYTTPARDENLPRRGDGKPFGERGGADAFLDFIETDLRPEIAGRLPINHDRQTLMGHSLGGFLVLHCLATRPHLFSTYVAGSSSIWWNNHELIRSIGALADKTSDLSGKRVLVAIGADELEDMLADSRRLKEIMAPLTKYGLALEYVEFAGEEHITVVPALVSRAISFSLRTSSE